MTTKTVWLGVWKVLLVAALAYSCPAKADLELTRPDGQRVLLKDDGTWLYVEVKGKDQSGEKNKQDGEAILLLERMIEGEDSCKFVVLLINNLPYEIGNIVPQYSAYRLDGVIYKTMTAGSAFNRLHPGDRQRREFQFTGIACKDIARLQVRGGDRCDMGDLNKWSDGKGLCLERVRVVASDLLRFDK